MDNKQFIEIKRVLSNDDKVNTSVQPESIDVDLIESFRGWHKGRNDQLISGEMTILVLKSREPKENKDGDDAVKVKSKVKTMLIQEAYKDFLGRMSSRVLVRRLE